MIRTLANSSLRAPALIAFGTSLAFSAAAQTPPSDADAQKKQGEDAAVLNTISVTAPRPDGYTVKESASATKLTLTPRETPQSMTIISRERLDDQNLTSLRQVLDNTPGIYSNAYDSERVLFYSRGFLIDTLMFDGVPALSSFDTGSIDETLDTSLYDRVEIVRGATGLMTGAGNPGASINLVRKHADSKTPTVSFDLTAGSWKNRRAQVDATVPLTADGRIRARGVAMVSDTESYQALYNKKKNVFYGIIDADLTPRTRASIGADYQDNDPHSNTWGSFPLFLSDGSRADLARSVTTATDWSHWRRETQTTFGEVRHTFDNGWALRSTLSHRQFKEDVSLFYVSGYPDPVTGLGLVPYAYKSKGKIDENSLDVYASGPFDLLGRKHELVLGYNGSRAKNVGTEQATDGALAPTGNFFTWDGSYPEPAFVAPTPLNDIRTQQDAVYAAGRFSLTDSLKLIGGARYASWRVDSFYVYDTPNNSKYNFSKVIPYAGLVWDFLPQYSAFASYTGIFKPQNNRDINGKYLDPMNGRSIETGIKGEHFDKRLNTSFTVFETRQSNVAAPVLDPVSGAALRLPDGSTVSQAIDGTTTRGFEAEASGRINSELQGSIGWTRYLTKDGDGNTIRSFIPSTLVRLFATWEPRRWVQHLTLGGGVNWQSASSTTVASPTGAATIRQGSVAQVSAMARYQFSPNVSLQFNANNIFDKKFFVLDQYDNTYYGAPANFALTLRMAY